MTRPKTRWKSEGLSGLTSNGMANPFPALPLDGHDEASALLIQLFQSRSRYAAPITVHFDFNILATAFYGLDGFVH
jgi:hypothetical protein